MPKKYARSPELQVKEILLDLPTANHYWLAYSGGVDSHLLLHLLVKIKAQLKAGLTAVHINHGFSQKASAWQQHCQATCQHYGVAYRAFKLDKTPGKQYSEAWAREKRYQILGRILQAGDVLLTAHHMNDQAETMLLHLLRGAGPAGLAAMPIVRQFSVGLLVRPLLAFSKAEIKYYANKESLHWIEDESNDEIAYDRNYLRHEIIPSLLDRWPAAIRTINRAAQHQAEINKLMTEILAPDVADICPDDSLDIAQLNELSKVRKSYLLRHWLKRNKLPVPGKALIDKLSSEIIHAGRDRNPCIAWPGAEVRRYRNRLYAMCPQTHDPQQKIRWHLPAVLKLPLGKLSAKRLQGAGIKQAAVLNDTLEIRYRQGGEKIKPVGSAHTRQLKKLFQAQGIPPWRRDRIPLLYLENKLIAVSNLWIDSLYAASATEAGWKIEWDD